MIESEGCILAFDPFMEMPLDNAIDEPGRPELAELYRKADRVYISHGHFDHIYHFRNIYKGTATPIYGTAEPMKTLERDGLDPGQLKLIAPGYRETFGPFEIEDPISSFEDEVVENVDVVKFLSKLDEKDKQILQMRQDGYTYKEIAEKVGFKTHSAVGKRINKIGRMYENYSGLNFGF